MTASPRRRIVTNVVVGACAAAVAVSLGLSAWTFVRQSQADTIRQADAKAQNAAAVATCFQKNQAAPESIRLLKAVDIGFLNTILSTKAVLKSQPEPSLRKRRLQSLKTLREARKLIAGYIARTLRERPTKRSCLKLAAKHGVDPKPYLNVR